MSRPLQLAAASMLRCYGGGMPGCKSEWFLNVACIQVRILEVENNKKK